MFDRVCIIGFGLIGSSLARAMAEVKFCHTIVCADNDKGICDRVMELGLAAVATTNCAEAVRNADLVILCVPAGACAGVMKEIAAYLKAGSVVTDVCSVKESVIRTVAPFIPPHVSFVPGHPVAGTADSGPDAGFAALFDGRWVILTPDNDADPVAVGKIAALWESCGARVQIMTPAQHDSVLACISHLPQMAAYALINTVADQEKESEYDVIKFFGGGFKDTTRIAGSDPVMWRDICLHNKDRILPILRNFKEHITVLEDSISAGDAEKIYSLFSQARAIRREKVDHV